MDQERKVRRVGKVLQQATAVFADAEIIYPKAVAWLEKMIRENQ